jgi:hypothetical protein
MNSLYTMTGVIAAATATLLGGCSSDSTGPEYNPEIPGDWASSVTNQFYPLVPGTTYQYEGETAEGVETITIEVLEGTRTVNGVVATVVRDQAFLDGELIEDTEDWFAQDLDGNVWYLGEDTKEYENGQVVSTEGSWEWGVDGALPGIVMWADPAAHLNEEYQQEFYEGEAEDRGTVVATDASVTVPDGTFTGCIQTEDTTPLEPDLLERKTYYPGIGLTLEENLNGSGERVELVSVTGP